MNNATPKITSYEELKAEELRLREIVREKRAKIQSDLRDLKEDFKPVIAAANTVGEMLAPEKQNHLAVQMGTNLTIDYLASKVFPRAGFLLRLLMPKMLKNYTSHYVDKAVNKAAPALRKFGTALTSSAKKA